MKLLELVSIIVPVYNVEQYIDRCVESIINQKYTNIEVILVDDGATDNSGILCDKYASEFCNVKVIHKENGGLSSARNAGMEIASGKYISFIDSDDWISVDFYNYAISRIIKYNLDALQLGFIKTDHVIVDFQQSVEKINILEDKEIIQDYMYTSTKTGSYSVWKIVYRKSVLEGLKFREGKINEDIDYNYKALSNCRRFGKSNQVLYFYFQSDSSLSTGGLKKKDFDLYCAANELYLLTRNETYGYISKLGKVKKARTAYSLLAKIAYFGISDQQLEKKRVVRELIKENRKNIFTLIASPMPLSRKILAISFAIDYRVTERCVRLLKSKISI